MEKALAAVLTREIRAPRGKHLGCKGWTQEAAMRMLMNNLDPEVAEKPQELIVYGGSGKAARNWEAYEQIVKSLQALENNETLLIQSGKAVGILKTHGRAPRVIIANSLLVPKWATRDYFQELEARGLTMFGQMTAGSWIYIGTQGILQGTYETLRAAAERHFGGNLKGKLVVTAGLGGMGGAQPLAITFNQGVCLAAEVDRERIMRRLQTGYCDTMAEDLPRAVSLARQYTAEKEAHSIAYLGNAVDLLEYLVKMDITPDLLTDQTAAHDPLNGYVPHGIPFNQAIALRRSHPNQYMQRAMSSIAAHMRAMLELQRRGAVTFEYGNNLRGMALEAGVTEAFLVPGFVQAYIRPLFCQGKGPFRWVALSGDPQDIHRTDKAVMETFPDNKGLSGWLTLASKKVKFQGLPARICWLGYGERDKIGLLFNQMVTKGQLKGPIVIGRDHLDCGSVASPNRETEKMLDGSDAIADWPILNALINAVNGASWVSVHHGGGVGIGYSIHAGMVVVADGSREAAWRLKRVLVSDPASGIIRHADAGYPEAIATAQRKKIKLPGINL